MNKYLENVLNHLSEEERIEIKANNQYLPEKLVLLLLKRVHLTNVQDLINLIKKTVPHQFIQKLMKK